MREILFHGKRTDNGEWIEGTLILTTAVEQKPYIVDSCWCPYRKTTEEGYADFEWLNAYEVIPETVGQYTSLTDKNGKKIFEGDIVKAFKHNEEQFICTITYRVGCFWFGNWNWCEFLNIFRNYEVIGNIHDNPELLKGE